MYSRVRRTFREQGLAPKKWLGQNFLADSKYLKKIVRTAGISNGDAIIEIGSGLGSLTEELINQGAEVWALEIDSGFFRELEKKFAGFGQVHLIHADALKFDFNSLAQRLGKLKIVANLPYSVSSRLLFRFYENRGSFLTLHVLLQKEVAERLVAPYGTKDYGILTVLFGATAIVKLLFDIPARAFYPKPRVVSTMVAISFRDAPLVSMLDPGLFTALVKSAFRGRRKTMRNSFRVAPVAEVSADVLEMASASVDIDLGRRAQTMSPSEFARLADELRLFLGMSAKG